MREKKIRVAKLDNSDNGCGGRTRTGTPSLAADFERRGFSGIWGYSEALKGTIHLAKRINIR